MAYRFEKQKQERTCEQCGNLFIGLPRATCCSETCRANRRLKHKNAGVAGHDYIECPICKSHVKQITKKHAQTHGYTDAVHMQQALGLSSITCEAVKELYKGENNPGFDHGGRLSKLSKNFIHGYDAEWHAEFLKNNAAVRQEHPEKFINNVSYWINAANGDVALGTEQYRKFQTRDLEFFVNRYGAEEGAKRHREKTQKWLKTLSEKPQEEIDRINSLKAASIGNRSTAEKEIEAVLIANGFDVEIQKLIKRDDGGWFSYDICVNNKILEYNGDYWHCNPAKYDGSFFNTRVNKSAKDIWAKDAAKTTLAEASGFKIMTVWESDYLANKDAVINRCIEFLTS